MASIFTYETSPVRLASPWPAAKAKSKVVPRRSNLETTSESTEQLSDYGITRLIPEPQDGPVEYKLHLLLRPRRNFSATSTVQKVSGSHLSSPRTPSVESKNRSDFTTNLGSASPLLATSSLSRQNRLHHLTTQLLWRLQQSCPHHGSSRSDLVVPQLPEADIEKSLLQGPSRLVGGLEESQGALYEIGVSDDGSLVGLTHDELLESITLLRAMAYSLGCQLNVLRMIDVGECRWEEIRASDGMGQHVQEHHEPLKIAEVLVSPSAYPYSSVERDPPLIQAADMFGEIANIKTKQQAKGSHRQLRISLTGSTTSGKSSLLGTLSTSTLDHGRGKSRLSLLKHRHEIVSGVTSSLAQELIGYQDTSFGQMLRNETQVINYASPNVSSWHDIHSQAQGGRLVFVTDSAGHPRYRRTTIRGLISWAPDWTFCCVAADEHDDSSGRAGATASAADLFRGSSAEVDLSKPYLDICLKLDLPLVVLITKLDLASKAGLRRTLTKVLSTLKEAGRKPVILPETSRNSESSQGDYLLREDDRAVQGALGSNSANDLRIIVPVVLCSAVTGVGISKIHSLFRHLPLTAGPLMDPNNVEDRPGVLFHIDEVFTVDESRGNESMKGLNSLSDFIVSGYLRYGLLDVGQLVLVGPSSSESSTQTVDTSNLQSPSSYPGKISPRILPSPSYGHRPLSGVQNPAAPDFGSPLDEQECWYTASITSIRYLRLPVRSLHQGQVATLGLTLPEHTKLRISRPEIRASATASLRRGMVLLQSRPHHGETPEVPSAYGSFSAVFKEPNVYVIPGSSVTINIASIRAPAKILEVKIPETLGTLDEIFEFDQQDKLDATQSASLRSTWATQAGPESIEITFQFISSREWIEVGTTVFVTPAGGLSMVNPPERGESSNVGFEGFVGHIVRAFA